MTLIPHDLQTKFEFHNYGHALEILDQSFREEWSELQDCLRKLEITVDDLIAQGGNETNIPKKFDDVLYPYGWREIRITGDLIVKLYPRQASQRGRFSSTPFDEKTCIAILMGITSTLSRGKSHLISSRTAKIRHLIEIFSPCEHVFRLRVG